MIHLQPGALLLVTVLKLETGLVVKESVRAQPLNNLILFFLREVPGHLSLRLPVLVLLEK